MFVNTPKYYFGVLTNIELSFNIFLSVLAILNVPHAVATHLASNYSSIHRAIFAENKARIAHAHVQREHWKTSD